MSVLLISRLLLASLLWAPGGCLPAEAPPLPDGHAPPESAPALARPAAIDADVESFWESVREGSESGFSGTRLYEYFEWPLDVNGETVSAEEFPSDASYAYLVDSQEPIRERLFAVVPVAAGDGEWHVSAEAEQEVDGEVYEYGVVVVIRRFERYVNSMDSGYRIVSVMNVG